ncbi:PEPxxWA-CTERM sorting domain-containing protein [Sphingomonas sp. GB1N7]|uniref:PEPxxWA-CTERM sorting domain-containing protein n=1 Tax=Parasphingomonas caseinilytica TaxID=3096158 RepID=UPI002FC944B8
MVISRKFAVILATIVFPAAAQAQQIQAGADIFNGTGYGTSYKGVGGTVQPSGAWLGAVRDGGFDTFDNFGFYNSGVGTLALNRQVELLSGNVYRFFDTFTNTQSTAITTTVNFFGNLGSDGDELISYNAAGLMVSCEDDGAGACIDDAVIALVAGNNGLARQSITPDRYNVGYTFTLAAGASISLLNYAFLARDVDGPLDSDVALATTTGQALLAAPRLEGLTTAQIANIANFAVSAVPEPSTWMMMILGFGLVGVTLRRRPSVRFSV